jgi:hypothetical protein
MGGAKQRRDEAAGGRGDPAFNPSTLVAASRLMMTQKTHVLFEPKKKELKAFVVFLLVL